MAFTRSPVRSRSGPPTFAATRGAQYLAPLLLTRWQCGLELKRFEKPAEWGERYRQQIADIRLAPSGRRADARQHTLRTWF